MADVNGKIADFKEDYAFIFGDASKWSRDFIVSGKEEVARTMVFSNTIPNASGVLMRKCVRSSWGARNDLAVNGLALLCPITPTRRPYLLRHPLNSSGSMMTKQSSYGELQAFDEILAVPNLRRRTMDHPRNTSARMRIHVVGK